ncbi:NUDIX hydrolase [Achromobacter sp. SD115]|uniref:NUDIX hydrolase n=1 Tax=Achromobacter sp. SD115 TaxID=2782011 RepID=UPI001A95F981|nr:NUDIX hydrolase [Achromobacter sp. SD115]MBO1013815.1 NUDIX hydrolase [Achromobacter sp. SD115]
MTAPPPQRPIAATIAAVVREGHVLLVQRANPPDQGRWAFPGGKIDAGEGVLAAAARELLEETGVRAESLHVFDAVDVYDRDDTGALRRHFILIAVLCRWQAGEPVAGDDAADARWVSLEELDAHSLATSFGVAELAHKAAALSAAL